MYRKYFFIRSSPASFIIRWNRDERGQAMVEYVLLVVLVAVALIGAFAPVANALIKIIGEIRAAVLGGGNFG
jgi:Flp pilus assembly pilin Flp